MSTITLENVRACSDITMKARLKDNGVAVDWSGLTDIKALVYSDDQKAVAGRCAVSVDSEDPTVLVCLYAATKPQYLGVNSIIVRAKYMGREKTYDKQAVNIVARTAELEGEQVVLEDPEVTVDIEVTEVDSSILDAAIAAAFDAADRAEAAAAAAEQMVDIHTGPAGKSAYEVAVEEGYTGTEEEWLASLKGPVGETPDISIGTVTTVEPGTPAGATMTGTPEAPVLNLSIPKGLVGATPNFRIGTVTTGEPGTPVVVTLTGTAEAPVLNITIPQGMQGNTGSSVDYPFELVNNLTTDDATKALSAAQGVVLDGKISQLQQEVTADISQLGQEVDEDVYEINKDLSTLVPILYDIMPGLEWTNGMAYNNNAISTNSTYQRTLPFDLKKGETIRFSGGKGSTSLIINALARYNNGTLSNLVAYTEESGQSVEYTATEDIQVIVSSFKTAFGGSVTIEATNDIVPDVELCKSNIGPKKFEYTDNSTINPFIEKIELNGTFDNRRLGFYRYINGNGFNIQIRQGSTIVALSADQLGDLIKDGISKVPLNEYNNSGVSGHIWCDTSKLLAITTLSSIMAQESISGAWLLPSLRPQMDMVFDTFFGATRFPAVVWENGMIYNGSGVSDNASFQKATLVLRKGETIKFHGGDGDTALSYINAVSKKVGNSVSLLVAYTSDDEDITYTANEDMWVIVSSAKASFGGTLTIIEPSFVKEIKGNVRGIVVDKTGLGDYVSLSEAIIKEGEIPNTTFFVNDGEYDIIQELTDYYGSSFFNNFAQDDLHRGLYLRNRMRLVFSTNAIVKCNYTGADANVMGWLSAFNAGANGFELINADIRCSNIRYCVHDERGGTKDAYRNVYKNCRMYMDNSGNTGWQSKQCIGGGCGLSGDIVIEDCYFESIGETGSIVSYHNSATADAKSNIVIRGCYFVGVSTCSIQWYGTTTKITRLMASNNSLGAAIIHRAENSSATTQNTELIEWNNVIRSYSHN